MTSTFTRLPRTLIEQRRNRAWNPVAALTTAGYTTQMSGGTGTPTLAMAGASGLPVAITTSMKMTLAGTVTGYWGIRFQSIDTVPGSTYTFSTYGYTNVARQTLAVIDWLDSGGAYISASYGTQSAHAAGAWEQRSVIGVTAPAGAVFAAVMFRIVTGVSGNLGYMTGLLMEKTNTLGTFFSGDTPDSPPWFYRWGGSPNNTSSIASFGSAADIVTPVTLDGYQATRAAGTLTQQKANSAQVIATLMPAGPRSGSLELVFTTAMLAAAALDVFSGANYYTLTDDVTPSIGMTFAVTGGSLNLSVDDSRAAWVLTVPFMELL